MRFRVTDRMLAALSGLLIIALGVALGLFGAGLFPNLDLSFLQGPFTIWQRAIIIAVALLLCLLGIHGLWMLFRRRADKGFIMQRTDMGDMSIAMSALKSMVKKCVDQHQEVSVKKIHIHRLRNGIIVDLKILLANGINIPLTVNVLQKQIKQYITSCSGVDVHEVRVQVDTSNLSIEEKKEEMPVLEQEAAPAALLQEEPVVETAAESILRHTEEPADYVAPVATEVFEPVVVQEEIPQEQEVMPVVEEMVETIVADECPVTEYVQEAVSYVEEMPAEAENAAEAFCAEEVQEAVETAETFVEEAQELTADAQETVEETIENIVENVEETSSESDLWAQVGEAFVRQDEAEETAE
ncbi:MAG: alkaline shock response membrane anchor protein AmaP [Clostridiales bacterium]|nr:alkaline shock response membrane anchor protein AmaP [Clostridiales bacterium]